MVAAPVFGYLGDRFNRKVILSCGIFFWSAVTFSSSFIPQQHFWLLVLSRGLVGLGEASYSTIAPTIIGDLFTKNTRTLMLSVFYFAIPLGSGLGYITGSSVKQAAGDWHWALRVSPIVGMITGTLILILVPATKRGHADQLGGQVRVHSSWLRDMKALIRNRSYVFSSLATSAVSFATGALGMWIPLYLHRAQVVQKTPGPRGSFPRGGPRRPPALSLALSGALGDFPSCQPATPVSLSAQACRPRGGVGSLRGSLPAPSGGP
ncbi:unnamed protein product [Gulo gulo]|uniref:Major facilitator superfamily (MFS) profile domain-containing protein n=1 Tax=Gulo gulo TaxID=48420 RepID=A0A9X9LIE0_GULGU|nr:unnamed protein product [Gulo gulo]